MGKGNKNRKNKDDASTNSGNTKKETSSSTINTSDIIATRELKAAATTTTTTVTNNNTNLPSSKAGISSSTSSSSSSIPSSNQKQYDDGSLYSWCIREKEGILWLLSSIAVGIFFGFGIGSGWLVGETWYQPPNFWRISVGGQIRSNPAYMFLSTSTSTFINMFGLSSIFGAEFGLISSTSSSSSSSSSSYPYPYPTTASSSSSSWTTSYQQHHHQQQRRKALKALPVQSTDPDVLYSNPSHPYIYAVLREAVIREKGGYVHPDLGIVQPAPCGAARGLGMVRDTYHNCQIKCIPGLAEEKLQAILEYEEHYDASEELYQCGVGSSNSNSNKDVDWYNNNNNSNDDNNDNINNEKKKSNNVAGRVYMQEEILVKVPLAYQMTRQVALDTLLPLLSAEGQRKASIHELDDAALLTLLLAHERGVGKYSRWLPYIAILPHEPSCGYSLNLRPYMLDSINALRDEIGIDVNGWSNELLKATQYAYRIVASLTRDYGPFMEHPDDVTAFDNIQWALCHVASRATGGSQKYGALRMVPLVDMINHDTDAGGMVELTGSERITEGDFIESLEEEDEGAFVVRSIRHGRRKALRAGQELLVNYNVPQYSALDWFVSSGFVPPERFEEWHKLDTPLPRIRRDGPFGAGSSSSSSSSSSNRPFFHHGGNPSR
jgi:hypothetical protein